LITVKPQSLLYPEPYLKFGSTRNDLVSKYGRPDYEIAKTDTTGLSMFYFDYSNSSPIVAHVFDLSDRLAFTTIFVKSENRPSLKTFLSERYPAFDIDNLTFVNALEPQDVTMFIRAALSNDSLYWLVYYWPGSFVTESARMGLNEPFDELEYLLQEFEKMDHSKLK
jgi:hypothetical protein